MEASLAASSVVLFILALVLAIVIFRRRGDRKELLRLRAEVARLEEELRTANARAKSPERLAFIAKTAWEYAEQKGGTGKDKRRAAIECGKKLDAGDNGVRDFSDSQISLAIEAYCQKA